MKGEVLFINDSAATIPEAVAFTCSNSPFLYHLICGGTDKNLSPDAMIEELEGASSLSLLDGSFTQAKLLPLLKERKIDYMGPFSTMDDALSASYHEALAKHTQVPNIIQVILLSPGAASFELFINEFDRGNQFKALVSALASS